MAEPAFAIVVTFRLKAGSYKGFLPHLMEVAEASVREEPGCQQYQVLHDENDPDTIVLYEVYDDEAAFEAHRQKAHFLKFDEQRQPLSEERSVRRCSLIKA